MSTKRKAQEQAQVAAGQNVRPYNIRASRRTFDECLQIVENGVNELNQMMEEFKKSRLEHEAEPQAKKPRKATKRKATNAETKKPANTQGKKATIAQEKKETNMQVKKPRKPRVKKPAQVKEPTTGQAKKPRKPRVIKLKSTSNGIEKMDQSLDQAKSNPAVAQAKTESMETIGYQAVAPKKNKQSSKSKALSKIKKEATNSKSMVKLMLEKEPKGCEFMATPKVKALPQIGDAPASKFMEMLLQQ